MDKKTLSDLAFYGHSPSFDAPLHVGRPNLGDRQRLQGRIEGILDRNWLTNQGQLVQELEARIAEFVGVRHCIAVSNGTAGLEIVLRASGMTGEVIMPAFTFIATAHAVRWMNMTPVFCDVGVRTHTIDPAQIEALITPATSGIIGVHLWGRPCEIEAVQEIATRHGLRLVFDAAHAFACSYRGRMIGSFGDAEVFSFHATKLLNAGEGGAIVTNDDEIAHLARLMRNFGFAGIDRVTELGTNGKMSEFAAAVALTNFESIDFFKDAHRMCYERYTSGLEGIPGISLVPFDTSEVCTFQYVVIEVDATAAGLGRDLLVDLLCAENVLARRYFTPGCHRSAPYTRETQNRAVDLSGTDFLAARVVCLPTGSAVSEEQVDRICDLIRFILANGPEIERRIAGKSLSASPRN